MTARSRQTYKELVTLPELGIPLAETALLMACEEYPQLVLSPYLDELDRLADEVRGRLQGGESPPEIIAALNDVLFVENGFSGNSSSYYDPRNSFLNEVLDRRTGVPITLSTVYMEVARRIGFRIEGVGMPGHFLVKYRSRDEEIFIDPFNAGALLSREECRGFLRNLDDGSYPEADRWLSRVTNRQILARMLQNLKAIYLKAGTFDKALVMVDLMLLTEPHAAELYRERGLLRLQVRQFGGAFRDLGRYLRYKPEAEDRSQIEDYLKDLRRIRAMMN